MTKYNSEYIRYFMSNYFEAYLNKNILTFIFISSFLLLLHFNSSRAQDFLGQVQGKKVQHHLQHIKETLHIAAVLQVQITVVIVIIITTTTIVVIIIAINSYSDHPAQHVPIYANTVQSRLVQRRPPIQLHLEGKL